MFDELYNKAKKQLIPENKAPKEEIKPTQAPVEEKKGLVLPVAAPPPTVAPQTPNTIASTSLSHNEQEALLQKRKQIPGWVLLLKYLSLLLLIIGIAGVLWLKADLDKNNKYLSIFNATENTGSKHKKFTKIKRQKDQEKLEYTGKIARIEQQLESKNYSVFTQNIQSIRGEQLNWFDTSDEEGNLVYGILEGPSHAVQYFNSKDFDDQVLSNTGNNIQVGDVSANKKEVSFGVKGAHLFGKAFFLNTEFISLMNAFPIYKGGSINSFAKKRDSNGNQSMDFSLKLALQSPTEIDPADDGFMKYEKWSQTLNSKTQ